MSKLIKIAAASLLALAGARAHAGVVNDTYVGANNHNYGDVIGDSTYDIARAEVTKTGTILTIRIVTNFAGHAGVMPGVATNGIGYGDLFLNSSWNPFGVDAAHLNDNAGNGTKWSYGLALDNRWNNTGGTFTLYQLTGVNNAANILNSNSYLAPNCTSPNCYYRDGQAAAVKTSSGTGAQKVSVGGSTVKGSWQVSDANNDIIFTLNVAGTGLNSLNDIALHWGETCQNDVIEGLASVTVQTPEPGSFALLGLGLAGLAALRRRKP